MLSLTPTTASLLGRLITPLTKRSEDAESTPEPLTQVVNSSFITTDFHALQFDAASSLQILPLFEPKYFRSWDKYLVTSPYNSSNHLLDLTRLALQDRIFTLALTVLRPIREDYATAPYEDSFNWSDVLEVVRRLSDKVGITWTTRDFYTVIFRSKVRKDCDEKLLTDLDIHSHEEAVVSGGLLRYVRKFPHASFYDLRTNFSVVRNPQRRETKSSHM